MFKGKFDGNLFSKRSSNKHKKTMKPFTIL